LGVFEHAPEIGMKATRESIERHVEPDTRTLSMPYTTDTTPKAEEIQLSILRGMSGRERVRQTFVLSSHLRQMAFDAIRRRFPAMGDSDVKLLFIEHTYGKPLADAIRTQENRGKH
jgi:hypothetical protein